MICKNCSVEYDDKCEKCPGCGTESEADSTEPETKANEQEEILQTKSEQLSEGAKAKSEAVVDKKTHQNAKNKAPEKVKVAAKPVKRPAKATEKFVQAEKKRQKRASTCIIVLMCLVAVLAVGLTAVSIVTDIFDDEDSAEKVVASVGFTPQQEKELEEVLSKCFSAAKKEYDCKSAETEDLLERINPADKGNVYSRLNDVAEALQTEADPADRFADENGEYAYYKLEESKVDKVLELFSLESCRGENRESFYYCDGCYYFAAEEASETPIVSAEVIKSRRVLDGSYYVEGYFYVEKGRETVKTDNCNFVVEMNEDEQTGEVSFKLRKISVKPIFGSDGKLVDSAKSAEKKREVIEGHTDDGLLFCRYVVEYPLLVGEGEGYRNVNEFFKNAVSVYEMKAQAAEQSYKDFKANGGDESQLPLAENVVLKVVFEDDKNISFITKISSLGFTAVKDDEQEENSASGLYETSVEAYTIDKESGNFVSKDSVLGKDYLLLGELLFRIYNGYEYENILPQEEEDSEDGYYYDETPEDTEGLGAIIYESAWSLSEKGVTFYYVTREGYIREVTLPYEVIEKIKNQ